MSDDRGPIRTWWRVAVLVTLIVVSGVFVLGIGPAGDSTAVSESNAVAQSAVTDLSYGLDLAGGTRIRAPVVGLTAETPTVDSQNVPELERAIAAQLANASPTDVTVRPRPRERDSGAIEVTTENVSRTALATALDAEQVSYEQIRSGVTDETREETVKVLNDKLNRGGLGGASVREVSTSSGEFLILIEVPDQDRQAVQDVISDRGVVRIDIYHPTQNGYATEEAVLERDDFQSIGTAQRGERTGPHVPVVLSSDAAARFETATGETGFLPRGSNCAYDYAPNQSEACLLTLVDGEVVYSAGMAPSLARNIASGEWAQEGSFVLQTRDYEEASELTLHLRAGALPTTLDVENGTSTYISPTQGDQFKTSSLIIGLIATLAVALKVFYRYRDIRVAAPMVLTAMSEITILLGITAIINYPIDLAVVGGLIAVIGTGVDDLIIIANEVLAKGNVNSTRVFRSRFNKAFWVIASAAVTTIIAMSPLMLLSLGDLRGFAIFTIIGVIIGVTITRPAYGDILEYLLIKRG